MERGQFLPSVETGALDPKDDEITLLRRENLALIKRRADKPGNEEHTRFLSVNKRIDEIEIANQKSQT